jgi:malonate-semialdehyde dehydrogenase (acetylating)/methylmalonate-semialdehyde dehydrogenase
MVVLMIQLNHYINGQFAPSPESMFLNVENPGNGEVITQVPLSTRKQVGQAVSAAQSAFTVWRHTPVSKRVSYLYKLVQLLRENEDQISRTLVLEMGKSLPDAYAEMKRVFENIETACGMPMLQQGDKAIGCASGIDGEVLRLPLGVFGIISPFNFPAMVPFWFLPYAIATGNTCVVKVSEQVPGTMSLIAKYIDQTGLPAGVFNLVHGDKTAAAALLDHPLVKGVSFVGSSQIAKLVAEKCAQTNKRCQAMGGAKNHLVVMPDTKINEVVRNMIVSCFGCAGQRCMAASAIVTVGQETHQLICEQLIAAAKKLTVANPLDSKVLNDATAVGPVISAAAKERILGLIQEGVDEGATLALDGRNITVLDGQAGHYVGPTIFTDVKPGMKIHQTEIFGPVVVIINANTLDEAIEIINNHPYGNGASIYTQNGHWAREFKLNVECGMIGVNVGIPAPVAYLPFGGMKQSIFSNTKAQGKAVIDFYTEQKIITERYWPEG